MPPSSVVWRRLVFGRASRRISASDTAERQLVVAYKLPMICSPVHYENDHIVIFDDDVGSCW